MIASAWRMSGASIIWPSTLIAPLSRAPAPRAASRTRRAHATCASSARNALRTTAAWLGWMQPLSVNPDAAASCASAASPSRSGMFTYTASTAGRPWAEAASSTADLACSATSRYPPSGRRLVRPRIDAIRSSAPHITAMTPGAAAISAALSTPSGVSHSATTRQSPPSASSCALVSVLGSITCRYPVPRSAAMSAACSGVPVALTRTMTRAGSRSAAASAVRAASFPSAPTPSSRSRMTASAAASAFAYRSGRSAGQNSSAGPGRGGGSGAVILHLLLCRVLSLCLCVRPARRLWTAQHQRRPGDHGYDFAVLVARGVLEGHDPLAGPARGQPLVRDHRLTVDRVAVPDRSGELRVTEPEVRHDRALSKVRDGEADQDRHGEQAVHQALTELGRLAERGVQVQRLRVHGQRGEQRVICLADGPPGGVLVDDPGPQLLEPQPALPDDLGRRLAHDPLPSRDDTSDPTEGLLVLFQVGGVLGPGGGPLLRQVLRRPQVVGRLIPAQHLPGHGDLVHLGRPVGQPHDEGAGQHPGARELLARPERRGHLQRARRDVVVHRGHGRLDRRDVLPDPPVVVVLVDLPGGVEHEQPELGELRVGVGDVALHELLFRELAAGGVPGQGTLAQHVEGLLALRDGAHRVVD